MAAVGPAGQKRLVALAHMRFPHGKWDINVLQIIYFVHKMAKPNDFA